MAHQSVAGYVGRCAHQAKLGQFGAYGVYFRHQRDNPFLQCARCNSALDRSSGDACAQRFGQHQQIAGARICVCCQTANIDHSGDRQSVNWLRIANGMTADDGAAHFGRFGQAAAQNRSNHSWPNQVGREANNI